MLELDSSFFEASAAVNIAAVFSCNQSMRHLLSWVNILKLNEEQNKMYQIVEKIEIITLVVPVVS